MAGAVAPLMLTLLTVPTYLRLVGEVRFGVLALVWLLLSYFAMFDMGLGRGTVRAMSRLRVASREERSSLFWTAMAINTVFGAVGGLILWAAARVLFASWLRVPAELHSELFFALPWLAAAVPVATNLSVMVGALEGMERFLALNALQVFGSAVFQLFPLAVARWHRPELGWLIGSAVLARIVSSIPMFLACRKFVPLSSPRELNARQGRELFSFGGWITISGLLTPVMATMDRLLIGAISGAAAVTYYTIPCNFATKFSMLPASLSRTLFPRFSAQEVEQQGELGARALLALGAVLTCAVPAVIPLVHPFFHWWIGQTIAARSSHLGEVLLVGIWANGWSWISVAQLQARGRPDLVAKFHAVEVVPFLFALWMGLKWGGAEGAAVVWALRTFMDACLVLYASGMLQRVAASFMSGLSMLTFTAVTVRFATDSLPLRVVISFGVLCLGACWTAVFARHAFPSIRRSPFFAAAAR